jgi:hypothetical protein
MSRARGIGMALGSVAGAAGVVKQVQKAQQNGDRLLLLNALASALVVLTGLALAVRALRNRADSP